MGFLYFNVDLQISHVYTWQHCFERYANVCIVHLYNFRIFPQNLLIPHLQTYTFIAVFNNLIICLYRGIFAIDNTCNLKYFAVNACRLCNRRCKPVVQFTYVSDFRFISYLFLLLIRFYWIFYTAYQETASQPTLWKQTCVLRYITVLYTLIKALANN